MRMALGADDGTILGMVLRQGVDADRRSACCSASASRWRSPPSPATASRTRCSASARGIRSPTARSPRWCTIVSLIATLVPARARHARGSDDRLAC